MKEFGNRRNVATEEKGLLMEKQDKLDLEKGLNLWSHFLLEHPKSKQKWQSLIYLLHHEPTQDLQTLSKIQDGLLQEGLVEVLRLDAEDRVDISSKIPYQSRHRLLHFLLDYAAREVQKMNGGTPTLVEGAASLWQKQPSFLGVLYANGFLDELILEIARFKNMAQISVSIHERLLELLQQMVEVIPGKYRIGANSGDTSAWNNEKPRHQVRISGFKIGKYPLTQGLYSWVRNQGNINAYSKEDPPAAFPVQKITWHAALQFCNHFSKFQNMQSAYVIRPLQGQDGLSRLQVGWRAGSPGFRLPTEVEWEIAARANTRYLYSGSNKATEVGWCVNNAAGRSQGVGLLRSNDWGIYDMTGNVWEWCWDGYDSDAYKKREKVTNTQTPKQIPLDPHVESNGTRAIARGGAAGCIHFDCRNSYRGQFHPNKVISLIGLRLVQSIPDNLL